MLAPGQWPYILLFTAVYICNIYASFSVSQANAFRKFLPLFDRILVERSLPQVKTKGGIMIPEKAQGKVQEAVVVAVGSGVKNEVCACVNLHWQKKRIPPGY